MTAIRSAVSARGLDGPAERGLLDPHLHAYRAYFGVGPTVLGEGDDVVIRFPAHAGASYEATIATADELGSHRAVREYLARLGFGWDDRARLSTVPSPATFERRRQSEGTHEEGFTGRIYQIDGLSIPKPEWLSACVRGFVPYVVGTPDLYRQLRRRRRLSSLWSTPAEQAFFWGIQHDVTRHALFTHLVPSGAMRRFGERVDAWLRARRPLITPAPLLRFYENDLPRYCQSIWRDLPTPRRFATVFEARSNLTQLERAFDERLRTAERASVVWLWRDAEGSGPFQARQDAPGGLAS